MNGFLKVEAYGMNVETSTDKNYIFSNQGNNLVNKVRFCFVDCWTWNKPMRKNMGLYPLKRMYDLY